MDQPCTGPVTTAIVESSIVPHAMCERGQPDVSMESFQVFLFNDDVPYLARNEVL